MSKIESMNIGTNSNSVYVIRERTEINLIHFDSTSNQKLGTIDCAVCSSRIIPIFNTF